MRRGCTRTRTASHSRRMIDGKRGQGYANSALTSPGRGRDNGAAESQGAGGRPSVLAAILGPWHQRTEQRWEGPERTGPSVRLCGLCSLAEKRCCVRATPRAGTSVAPRDTVAQCQASLTGLFCLVGFLNGSI